MLCLAVPISTNPRMEHAPQKHGDMLRSLLSGGLVCSVVIRVLSSFVSRSRSEMSYVRLAACKCTDCHVFKTRSGSGRADVRFATDLHPPRCKSSSAFSVYLIHIFLRNCISISTCSGCRTPGCPISANPRMELAPQKHENMLRSLPSGGLVCSVVIRIVIRFAKPF